VPRIAIVSPLGGTGRTTVAAHMATLLTQRGRACLAIDLCPQNHLGSYLGLPHPAAEGWATSVAQDEWWAAHALENTHGVGWLPFGQLPPQDVQALYRRVAPSGHWLRDQLDQLDVPDQTCLLLDLPTWPAPLAQQALNTADVVLVTVDPSLRASQAFGLITAMMACAPPSARRGVLLTGMDARRTSHRDVLNALRAQWGDVLLHYVLHTDEGIAQAQAQATCVNLHAPYSQSAYDLQGIAGWLDAQLPPPEQPSPPEQAEL
jgi:cellulose synthase operon protein YhjQ